MHNLRRFLTVSTSVLALAVLSGCPTPNPPASSNKVVVLGYNDLGMHCMNEDFSEIMILPPYNTLHAQVIERRGEEPRILQSGVTVSYTIPGNTTSSDKTNFWDYVEDLFGVSVDPDVGLTGNGLSGTMVPTGTNDWVATGIPVTPVMDNDDLNPYPLATITVNRSGEDVATTQAVVPVSWEISCNLCHATDASDGQADASVAMDILTDHDRLHSTTLASQTPVACMECHAQAPLGTTGDPSLSHAMHGAHASRMAAANLQVDCYACHPGQVTQCLRDVHYANGMTCVDCHGDMTDVADPSRQPWADEPRCDDCHNKSGFEFEQPGTLYRDSKGHHGVHCAACHGSPHAITPSVEDADNVQAIALQGHAGTIDTCTVCHTQRPDDHFDHRLDDDGDEDEDDKLLVSALQ
ncbi:MAG: hypothetical protein IT365_14485 [Candidatus Hydrogenedentes bacterium]|nr:hypothetical protein [Candidatus Hydrogenedentota bacterium]